MIPAILLIALNQTQGPPTTPISEKKPKARFSAKKPPTKTPVTIQKPKIVLPPQPTGPKFADNPKGYGNPSQSGDVVTIQFLVKRKNGPDLADSKKRGLPYTFKIGEPGNDPLLDLVVKGMKVGAVRTATVRAVDAYGSEGAPPLIAGTDTLVVVITLLRRGDK
jgi:FKBP-type peptidyl-prolyl cis-trans isomerase